MTSIDVRTPTGETDGTVELPEEIFGVPENIPLIHQVVNAQLAAARQGTHSTKSRGQVRGGGRKPFRQKGTGRARQGSTRAPQHTGGGTVHGPTPRSYAQRTPRRMKQAALRSILSDRARAERIGVVSDFMKGDKPSTKAALATLEPWLGEGRILAILTPGEKSCWLSLRNLPRVHVISADQLNTYDVTRSDRVVFSRRALQAFIDRSVGGSQDATAPQATPPQTQPAEQDEEVSA